MLSHHTLASLCFLFFAAGLTHGASNVTHPDDVLALRELVKLVRASDLDLEGWEEGLDPCGESSCGVPPSTSCQWEGIACQEWPIASQVGRVIGIEISRGLSGPLPKRLPSLLRSLSLPDNNLDGNLGKKTCLPQCEDLWATQTKLENINLANNNISGTLPDWLGLTNLKTVSLQDNHLSGPLPDLWHKKEELILIDVSDNMLSGQLPPTWGTLPMLQKLSLGGNMFSKSIPDSWFDLPGLQLLNISANCALCGNVPKTLGFVVKGEGTNLNRPCNQCDGCDCSGRTLSFYFTNALISLSVLAGLLLLYCLRQWCVRRCRRRNTDIDDQGVSMHNMDGPVKVEVPTLIVMPDGQEICIGKRLPDKPGGSDDDTSFNFSEGGSISSDSDPDVDTVIGRGAEPDPRVLNFIMNTRMNAGRTAAISDRSDSFGSLPTTDSEEDNDLGEDYSIDVDEVVRAVGLGSVDTPRREVTVSSGEYRSGNPRRMNNMSDRFPEALLGPPPGPPGTFGSGRSSGGGRRRRHRSRYDPDFDDIPDVFPEAPVGPPGMTREEAMAFRNRLASSGRVLDLLTSSHNQSQGRGRHPGFARRQDAGPSQGVHSPRPPLHDSPRTMGSSGGHHRDSPRQVRSPRTAPTPRRHLRESSRSRQSDVQSHSHSSSHVPQNAFGGGGHGPGSWPRRRQEGHGPSRLREGGTHSYMAAGRSASGGNVPHSPSPLHQGVLMQDFGNSSGARQGRRQVPGHPVAHIAEERGSYQV